jgi:hypothetical protein
VSHSQKMLPLRDADSWCNHSVPQQGTVRNSSESQRQVSGVQRVYSSEEHVRRVLLFHSDVRHARYGEADMIPVPEGSERSGSRSDRGVSWKMFPLFPCDRGLSGPQALSRRCLLLPVPGREPRHLAVRQHCGLRHFGSCLSSYSWRRTAACGNVVG